MLDVAAALLVITALMAYLNQRLLHLPMTIGVMAIALILSLALVGLDASGVALGLHVREAEFLRGIDFSRLLMQGMLSLLLFAGALHVDVDALRAYRWQVALLSVVGTAISTLVIGFALFALLPWVGLPLPLLHCLLFGALISPTDPIAVIGMLKSAGAPRNLEVVIAGESLFNDGVGVVIFTLMLGLVVDGRMPSVSDAGMLLAREAGGGLMFGAVLGWATARLMRRVAQQQVEVLLTLAMVVGGYALADHLEISGPLAMVVAGLMVGHGLHGRPAVHGEARLLGLFWELIDEVLNAVLFVLVGMQVVLIHFPLAPGRAAVTGLIAVAITLAARWLTVGLPVALARENSGLPPGAAAILTWGGLRGGISIALALSVPAGADRETLVALTYCVVAFSILVQGLSFGRLVRETLRA